jgi:hypothetical protein
MSKDKPNMCGVCGRIFGWDDSCNCTPKPIESLDALKNRLSSFTTPRMYFDDDESYDNYLVTFADHLEAYITERERAAYKKGRDDERSCPAHTSLSTQEGDK